MRRCSQIAAPLRCAWPLSGGSGGCWLPPVGRGLIALVESDVAGSIYEVKNPRLVGLRKWSVKGFNKHLIFYLDRNDCIEIVRIIHAARDVLQVLAEEDL